MDTPVAKDGFRLRGLDMTRLETFVDAAIAFAVTFLVVSQGSVPRNYGELAEGLKAVPSFLVSFAIIAMVWYGHRKWSRRFGLEDIVTTLLSMGMVFILLVYVVPLRLMSSAFMSFVSGGFLPSEFTVDNATDLPGLFVVYGIGYFALAGCLALLYLRGKFVAEMRLNPLEVALTNQEVATWTTMAITGLVSAVFAAVTPTELGIWAGFVYPTMCFTMPWVSIRYGRRVAELRDQGV